MSAAEQQAPGTGLSAATWWETDKGVRNAAGYVCLTMDATHYKGQDERYARDVADRAANKSLIAAAPDLLKALKAFRDGGAGKDFKGWHGSYDDAIALARAAISKAEKGGT